MIYKEAIDLLGMKVKDKISGGSGHVTSVCFDLYGCIQVIINTGKISADGTLITLGWMDVNRLKILNHKRIMEHPEFILRVKTISGVKGPEIKPKI